MDRDDSPAKKVMYEPGEFAKLDHEINSCLMNSTGPAGMKDCLSSGMGAWDRELNKTYQSLMKELSENPAAQSALRNSENEWIKFRDAEFKLIDRQYKNASADTHPAVDVLANKLDLIETRTRELDSIKEQKLVETAMTNPLDRKLGACLQSASNEAEQRVCVSSGIEDWKNEFQAQTKLVPSRFRPGVQAAQSQWRKFQDAENEFIAQRFSNPQVTPAELSAYMNVFRDRTLQLSMRNSVRFK